MLVNHQQAMSGHVPGFPSPTVIDNNMIRSVIGLTRVSMEVIVTS